MAPDNYILGPGDQTEVNVFGEPDLTRTMTINRHDVPRRAHARGGGTDKANLDGAQLVRVENGKSKAIPIKATHMIQRKAATPNLKLQPGDLVYIPRRGMGIMDVLNNIGILRMILGL